MRGFRPAFCYVIVQEPITMSTTGEKQMTGFEDFMALPFGAQIGIFGFAVAILLLAIAQVLTVASHRSRDQAISFESLRSEIRQLARSEAGTGKGAVRGRGLGLAAPPRPVRRATSRKPVPLARSQSASPTQRRRA